MKEIEEWEVREAVNALIKAQEILTDERLLPKVRVEFAKRHAATVGAALELKVSAKQKTIRDKKD